MECLLSLIAAAIEQEMKAHPAFLIFLRIIVI
jgi:hypothetical protein